jgi:arylsulfatase A-like enzyme
MLRNALKERGIDQNTLILFNSDNGNGKFEQLDDLRGGKGSIWEGGLRVPAVAVWPEMIREPAETSVHVATWDIMPTLLDIAGVQVKNLVMDGVSFYPLLKGREMIREKPLCYWFYRRGVTDRILREHRPDEARNSVSKHLLNPEIVPASDPGWSTIIDGEWKYHLYPVSDPTARELYNIHADPGETINLAARYPEVVNTLDEKLSVWRTSVISSLRGEDYNVEPEIFFSQ